MRTQKTDALELLRKSRSLVRTGDAIAAGINPATLYRLRDEGVVERVSRGVYRLTERELPAAPDLATVAARVPGAVICLLSALEWHDLTTQIPHAVHITIRQGAWQPRLDYPPLRVFRLSEPCFSAGVEVHEMDGVTVRIYSAEKTLVDCFKYRHKIGLDVALEALKLYRQRGNIKVPDILRHAQTCRVSRVMRPYLEALLA